MRTAPHRSPPEHAPSAPTRTDVPLAWIEVWVDRDSRGNRLLVARSSASGRCEVVDPQNDWHRVHEFESYEAAYDWLRQEVYEPVEGRWTPPHRRREA